MQSMDFNIGCHRSFLCTIQFPLLNPTLVNFISDYNVPIRYHAAEDELGFASFYFGLVTVILNMHIRGMEIFLSFDLIVWIVAGHDVMHRCIFMLINIQVMFIYRAQMILF